MNKHQKAAHRVGERRVGREQVEDLLELSRSDDPMDRAEAAENLCPCHVRRRIEAVWEALYRLMEDSGTRVRRAAWHTLEDGGRPDDPALDAILDRIQKTETDKVVKQFVQRVAGSRARQELVTLQAGVVRPPTRRGRCDFCGEDNLPVDYDYQTTIPGQKENRLALICVPCAKTF